MRGCRAWPPRATCLWPSAVRPWRRGRSCSPRGRRPARVPKVDDALLRHFQHGLAVRAHAMQDDGAPRGRSEPVVPGGDLEAGRKALDVPLPRPRDRLVEVVDVEDELALGRLEEAEVHEVGVAAELSAQPALRRPVQIRGHEQRPAAIERARRDEHAPIADGDEFGDPVGRLLLEQADRAGLWAGGASRRERSAARACGPPCRAPRAPPASACAAALFPEAARPLRTPSPRAR